MFIPRFFPYQTPYTSPFREAAHFFHLKRPVNLSLYLITDGLCDELFISKVLSAVKGGVTFVQIRASRENLEALITTAKKLKRLLDPLGVPIVINNHVDIALAVQVGVHLGQKDMSFHKAREILGPHVPIGLSVDTWDDVVEAQKLPVDYLGVSQLFGSRTTKPCCRQPWGLQGLENIRNFSKHRLVPVGGITLSNVVSVYQRLRLGPNEDGVAMVGELWRAEKPFAVAQKICALMKSSSTQQRGA